MHFLDDSIEHAWQKITNPDSEGYKYFVYIDPFGRLLCLKEDTHRRRYPNKFHAVLVGVYTSSVYKDQLAEDVKCTLDELQEE